MDVGRTSDAQPDKEEWLDVFDATGEMVGSLPRSDAHARGLWHQVFHCLVIRSEEPGRVLLQRRKRSARAFPGMLDISVAGHLSAGEQPLDGVREIREELGLTIDPARLVAMGERRFDDEAGEGHNREIAHVYVLVDDTPLEELQLDPGEVDGFVEMTTEDLIRMSADPARPVVGREVDTEGVVRSVSVIGADLVPGAGSYVIELSARAASTLRPG
jgi:isopentenyldiphosphate isomerase